MSAAPMGRSEIGWWSTGLACVSLLLACGGGSTGPEAASGQGALSVGEHTVDLTPDAGVGLLAYDVSEDVVALAAVPAGVLVGTATSELARECSTPAECDSGVCLGGACQFHGLQLLSGVHLYPVLVASEDGGPVTSGAILGLAPRADGALVLAEHGLFYTTGSELVYSPLNEAVDGLGVSAIAVSGSGADEVVWFVGGDGLYRVAQGEMVQVTVPDTSAPAHAVAEVDGAALIALANGTVWEVATGDGWAARVLGADLGAVHGLVAGGGEMAAATDAGVLWRSTDGAYVLIDVGAPVAAITHATAIGGQAGAAGFAALTSDTMVEVAGGEVVRSVSVDDGASIRPITSDERGHVWIGDGPVLTGVMVGEIVRFDEEGCAEGSPCRVMNDNCNMCHLDGSLAPMHDFTVFAEAEALADDIVHRVSIGNMPQGFSLSDPAYEALLTWYMTGQNP